MWDASEWTSVWLFLAVGAVALGAVYFFRWKWLKAQRELDALKAAQKEGDD